jgi:hypothetical protein
MKTTAFATVALLVLLCGGAHAAEPAGATLTYVCTGGAEHMKGSARVSSFLYTDPVEIPGSEYAKLEEAWSAHLETLHPGWYFATKNCAQLPSDNAERQRVIDGTAEPWKRQNAEMVHIAWKYAPVQKSPDDDVPSVFCQALRTDNKEWYVTAVFPMATAAEGTAAMNAWRTHLRSVKDSAGNSVGESYLSGCDGPGPAKAMRHQRAERDEKIRDGGGRVVETDWLPASAGTSAPTPQSAAVGGTNAQTYYCYQAAFGGNYATSAFSSTKDAQTVNADWRAYITKLHPAQGVVQTNCMVTTPKAAENQSAGYTRIDWRD